MATLPVVVPAGGSGTGLAAGAAAGFETFNQTLRDLAFFNLAKQKEEESFQRQSDLREQLLQTQINAQAQQDALRRDQQTAVLGKQQNFNAEQAELDRELRRELARLDRNERSAARKSKEDDPIFQLNRQGQTAPLFGLDFQDPIVRESFGAAQQGDLSPLQEQLELRQSLSNQLLPVLQSKDEQKRFFGRRLKKKEIERLTELALQAQRAPATFAPILQAEIAKLQEAPSEGESSLFQDLAFLLRSAGDLVPSTPTANASQFFVPR